ncbi:M48 family metalloprotease [Henriciella algicola]|jgi:predicted Zn-dependent protease|uniref:Peptidase M48 n=1 Tax=Henriciella algicola TaxID=1608422 RepID=A0A399RE24_9PROT|nr:M48 family metalloprotease [Henriciella algicola]RIJ28764.1 peptidase M48 [Henriciella algicola]
MPTRFLKGALAAALTAAAAMTASAQSLIRDAEIETTLRNWTDPILEVAGLDPDDVGLYIINDPELNAFVANGQRIHLHTGLLIAADTPGQIKGVIAHETCHIACGHSISRSRAANVASRPALISIGLGVLAMAAGAGDAGAALIASSQQFAALNFFVHTRAEEATADAAAVSYLAQLGQSPSGIVDFFDKYRVQEVLSESRRYPYFRSHPLASDRIRTTRALAEDTGLMDVEPDAQTVREFELMQAKLIGFLEPLARVYQKYPRDDESEPARYARAIAAMQSSDMTSALSEIDSLLEEFPENPYYWELKGQALFEMGRAAESVEPHAKSLEYLPGHPLLLINYGRSLIARADEGDLEAGEEALRDALIREPDNSFAWNQLASALEKQGRRAEAELATAESAYHIGDYQRAHIFARRAIEDLEDGTSQARRANDIRNVTDPALPENQDYWRRRG